LSLPPGGPFADLSAGLTVGIIALPLAIGFAIASGATPQQGLWTGIIAGLAVALLGGSRFQIAGHLERTHDDLASRRHHRRRREAAVAIFGHAGNANAPVGPAI